MRKSSPSDKDHFNTDPKGKSFASQPPPFLHFKVIWPDGSQDKDLSEDNFTKTLCLQKQVPYVLAALEK